MPLLDLSTISRPITIPLDEEFTMLLVISADKLPIKDIPFSDSISLLLIIIPSICLTIIAVLDSIVLNLTSIFLKNSSFSTELPMNSKPISPPEILLSEKL